MNYNTKPRFVILCPFYNVHNFIIECYQSVLSQDYDNWIIMFGDDNSSDGTLSQIPQLEPRFIKHQNNKNLGPLGNTINLIQKIPNPNPDDILVILDGDDKLLHNSVLSYLLNFYVQHNPLIVYGQYMNCFGGLGHARPISNIEEYINLRKGRFFMSHIRTWKYEAYQKLIAIDPNLMSLRDNNNDFFKFAGDVALMYSLAEVVGFERICFNPEPMYWYRIHGNNENRTEQIKTEEMIQNIIPLNRR